MRKAFLVSCIIIFWLQRSTLRMLKEWRSKKQTLAGFCPMLMRFKKWMIALELGLLMDCILGWCLGGIILLSFQMTILLSDFVWC